MTAKKQVDLIENVAKTILGVEGLKIVVACDKSREGKDLDEQFNKISFERIGKKCLIEINGNTIKEKYPNVEGIELAKRLHEERIKWIKAIDKD